MPNRIKPLTPWGKQVKIRMIAEDITAPELVEAIRAKGLRITGAKLSAMLSGSAGTRSPEMVEAIDSLLSIPAGVAGRPA